MWLPTTGEQCKMFYIPFKKWKKRLPTTDEQCIMLYNPFKKWNI
jgi:hypothetical protein